MLGSNGEPYIMHTDDSKRGFVYCIQCAVLLLCNLCAARCV